MRPGLSGLSVFPDLFILSIERKMKYPILQRVVRPGSILTIPVLRNKVGRKQNQSEGDMKNLVSRAAFLGMLVFVLILLTVSAQAQNQKIRVVVENAAIRISPSPDGEILMTPEIGSVYDVINKTNEWFEIKVTSRVGIEVSGFIHENSVELVGGEREVERIPVAGIDKPPSQSTPRKQPTSSSKFEILLGFGYALGYGLDDSSRYSNPIPPGIILEGGQYEGAIHAELDNPFGPALAVNYLFLNGLGLQARFDMNMKSSVNENSGSDFDMNWNWPWGGHSLAELTDIKNPAPWEVTGEASGLSVLSLNLYYKALGMGMIAPHFSGGLSYFMGKALVETVIGYGTRWSFEIPPDVYEVVDIFLIPAIADIEIGSIGANVGGGIDIAFSENLAAVLAARYFMTKKIEQTWKLADGDYESNIYEGVTLDLTPDRLMEIAESIDKFIFNPSFFKIILGIKLLF